MRPSFTSTSALRRPFVRSTPSSPFRTRPSHVGRTRFSTSSSANNNASPAQKRAQETLSSLQKTAEKAWSFTKTVLGPLGERAGSMLGAYRQPLLYNISVSREILRQIYIAERLQPPTSLSTIMDAYTTLWSRATSPAYWRQMASNGELVKVGILGIEAYGIFKIGEIIGRRHLVGYKLD